MTPKLDPKGLEAAVAASAEARRRHDTVAELSAAITAYLAATVPADVAAEPTAWQARFFENDRWGIWLLIAEDTYEHYRSLNRTNVEVRCLYTATALEALASRSPSETLERAAEVADAMPGYMQPRDAAAAIRSMKEPE